MASKIEKSAASLISTTVKTFGLNDIIKHRKNPFKNLYEISSMYPGQGVGFKFYRKTWPSNCYYVLQEIDMKALRHGNAYGTLYWKGLPQNTTPVRIRNGNKRGIWRYEVNDVNVTLDNGLTYSAAELNAYRHLAIAAEAAAEKTTTA